MEKLETKHKMEMSSLLEKVNKLENRRWWWNKENIQIIIYKKVYK